MLRRALRIALYFLLFVFVTGFLGLGHVAALPFGRRLVSTLGRKQPVHGP